jgi:radical SAM enzyme (TIGR01210 family)
MDLAKNTPAFRINKVMRSLRQAHFARSRDSVDPRKPVIYWEETNFKGKPFDVPLVILRTSPCRWFESGGCTMCNYELLAIDEGVSKSDILAQVDYAIEYLNPISRFPYVFMTSQGSFFDDREVPSDIRLEIADKLHSTGVQILATESEAKYCIDSRPLSDFKDRFKGYLSIGIGLEAHDELIRNGIINKGLSNTTFEAAAASLTESDIGFYCYILLGKPLLTIEEDINDAVAAIEFAMRNGASMAVIEVINIQPFTLVDILNANGMYRCASLWTALTLLNRIHPSIRHLVSIKGVEADVAPVPKALARSCDICTDELLQVIRGWNYSRDFSDITRLFGSCKCYETWQVESSQISTLSVSQRLESMLTRLEQQISLKGND